MLSKWIVNAVPSRVIVAEVVVSEFKVGVENKEVVVKDVEVFGTVVVVAEGEVEAGLVVVVKTASVEVVIVLLVVEVEIVEVVAAVVVVVVSRENKSCSLKERFLGNQIAIYVNVFLGLK